MCNQQGKQETVSRVKKQASTIIVQVMIS